MSSELNDSKNIKSKLQFDLDPDQPKVYQYYSYQGCFINDMTQYGSIDGIGGCIEMCRGYEQPYAGIYGMLV